MGKSTKNEAVNLLRIETPDATQDAQTTAVIETELAVNILVEAVPGSGKTYNLIRRLIALATTGKVPASNIAAITFTRKAAEELRTRFHEEMTTRIDRPETTHEECQILQKALVEIEDGYIGTIHGFCGAIIRQFPIEAGIDPTFQELEPEDSRIMLMNTWSHYLDANPDLIKFFTAAGISTRDEILARCLDLVASHPDVDFPELEAPRPPIETLQQQWENFYSAASALVPSGGVSNPDLDELEIKFFTGIERAHAGYGKALLEKDELGIWSAVAKNPGKIAKNRWSSVGAYEQLSQHLALYNEFLKSFNFAFTAALYKEMIRHIKRMTLLAGEERQRNGYLDFVDLLTLTAKLLREKPGIRKLVAMRYTRLLVDEFQDTDPVQAEIICLLTDPDGSSDWRQCRPQPGSLFVVGDPKQAIYRFRRGDIDTYVKIREMLTAGGGDARLLTLQANRRSVGEICDWVNQAFGNAFAAQQEMGQINFAAMAWHRAPVDRPAILRINRNVEDLRKTRQGNSDVCKLIAMLIHQAIDTGLEDICGGRVLKPEDFMIIARTNNILANIAVELERLEVPTSLSGGGTVLAESIRNDMLVLYWLLRAVALPSDSSLLYATLSGPLFGFSETDLYLHVGRFGRLSVFEEKLDESPVSQALKQLLGFSGLQREYPAGTVFRKLLVESGFYAWLQTCDAGEFKLKLLRDVEKMFDGKSFHDGIRTFGAWIEDWPSENRPADPGSVKLMSVFRAKGLEAPVVIFAGVQHRETIKEPLMCIKGSTETGEGHMRFARKWGEFGDRNFSVSPSWTGVVNDEKVAMTLENLRKEYVATTRARDCLLLASLCNPNTGSVKTVLGKKYENFANKLPVVRYQNQECCDDIELVGSEPVGMESALDDYEEFTLPVPDYQAFLAGLEEWRQKSAAESCLVSSVTGLAEPEDLSIFASDSDGGREHGSAVHQVLETAMRQRLQPDAELDANLEMLARHAVNDSLCWPLMKTALLEDLRNAIKHPLWQEAMAASLCFQEVPVAVLEKDLRSLPVKIDADKPLRLNGTIDLVYKTAAGWKIVDYKTDRINDDRHLQQLKTFHEKQLQLYGHLWEKLTGEKVVARTLLFVNSSRSIDC